MPPDSAAIKETVFADSNQFFAALLRDIDEAVAHIELETYIYDLDPLGKEVAEHLAAASRRGVSVRLLVDGVGSLTSGSALARQLCARRPLRAEECSALDEADRALVQTLVKRGILALSSPPRSTQESPA